MDSFDSSGDHGSDHHFALIAYLADDLPQPQQDEIDRHLISCDRCWREVQLVRSARAAAIGAAESAPEQLRAQLTAAFAESAEPDRAGEQPAGARMARTLRGRGPVAAAVLAAIVAAFFTGVAVTRGQDQPVGQVARPSDNASSSSGTRSTPDGSAVLAAAVASYDHAELPGTGVPSTPGPDLLDFGLHLMAASTGELVDQHVTVFAYANPNTGMKIFVYLSPTQFHALGLPPGKSTGTRSIGGLAVYADTTHPMLVLGTDAALVVKVGNRLT